MSPICLICLLQENKIQKIKEILTNNPGLLGQEYNGDCHHTQHSTDVRDINNKHLMIWNYSARFHGTLIQYILTEWTGTSDLSDLFIHLFQKSILNHNHFTNNLLSFFLMTRVKDVQPLNYFLLDILTIYLPKETWLNLQTNTNQNILHLVAESFMSYVAKERYFRLFVAMGVDPFPAAGKPNQSEILLDHPKSIVSRLISQNHPNLLKYIIETYRPDPSHFNESFYFRVSRTHPLTVGLAYPPSDLDYRRRLKETFQLCRKNKLDYTQFSIRHIFDYGWTEHLLEDDADNATRAIAAILAKNWESLSRLLSEDPTIVDYNRSLHFGCPDSLQWFTGSPLDYIRKINM